MCENSFKQLYGEHWSVLQMFKSHQKALKRDDAEEKQNNPSDFKVV